MEKSANLNIRIDSDLKKNAEKLFEDLGFNMSTAINIFLKQAVREQGIPFEIVRNVPNYQTIQSLNETCMVEKDANTPAYNKMEDVYKDLDL